MTEDERNKKLAEMGREYQFKPGHEAPKGAISKGVKEAFEYKKVRERFFKSLSGMKLSTGGEADFWAEASKMIQDAVFGKNPKIKLSDKEKLYFIKNMLKELPRDDKLTMDFGEKSNVHFYLPEKNKEEKIEQNKGNNIDGIDKDAENEQKTDSELKNDV